MQTLQDKRITPKLHAYVSKLNSHFRIIPFSESSSTAKYENVNVLTRYEVRERERGVGQTDSKRHQIYEEFRWHNKLMTYHEAFSSTKILGILSNLVKYTRNLDGIIS